jgi:ribosomal protein L37AE/L43A
MVAADQLDTARAIAAGPVPPDIVAASTAPIEEFELPRCPACGAEDPVLESAEPVNTWRCEACDAEWTDPAETADQEPQQA